MDEYTGQRVADGLVISRRGSSLSFRDSNHEDKSIQYCNRLRCSTRLNSMEGTNTVNQEKSRYSKLSLTSLCSSSSKTTVGSSSKSLAGMSNIRKHHQEQQQNPTSLKETVIGMNNLGKHHQEQQQNQISLEETVIGVSNLRKHHQEQQQSQESLKETVIAESSNKQEEVEAAELVPSNSGFQSGTEHENAKSIVFHGHSMNKTEEVGNTGPQTQIQLSGFGNQDTPIGSSIQHSFSSKNADQAAKSQGQGANAHRYGLRNLGAPDILPSSSSSDSGHSRRINMIKKRYPLDEESSSARGKKTDGSSSGASSQRNALSSPSLSSADQLTLQPASRRTRNWSAGSSRVGSVRTRRTISGGTSMRLSESDSVNVMSEHRMIPQLPQASINESASDSSSRSYPTELPSIFQNSFRRPGSSNESARSSRPTTCSEDSSTQPFHSFSLDRDGFRRFNMEGIAEVLLALDRIEQDEEYTNEQLLFMESNLFLGGLSFHDQHRDMRLDIDNMSYEELLTLEEKMGTVSTALTEEELPKCLKKSCYALAPLVPGIVGHEGDDTKCSICQEEYVVGDEVGKLGCEHRYHVVCIHKWLRQKNWCPICKVSLALS